MEKLSMCRVCLGEDIRLMPIVGTHLQEMYESLVLLPFETEDGRPILVCYICHARLKNCYELRKSCLQSEELLTQMLSCNESEQIRRQAINNKKRLIIHNAIHLSMGHVLRMDADNVGVEALKCEVKDEPNDGEDVTEGVLEESSISDNVPSADSHNDFVTTEEYEEQIGRRTSDSIPREPTQDVQRSFEETTSSNLNEYKLVQNKFKKLHDVTAADITDDNEISASVQYKCDTCQQCYSSKCELERHVRLCSNVLKKDLSRENTTSAHTHTNNVCNKRFLRNHHLNRHMFAPTNEALYQCHVCKEQFPQKDHLIRHMRTHTDDKPFRCDICKKQFSHRPNLTSHMRTHTGDKPFRCDICKKQFSNKPHLTSHMRTHTGEKPYYCNNCTKQFSEKNSLTRHLRTHTGEKPYHCNICTKQFTRQSSLTIHMRTHTGEKPYHCTTCKKNFSQKISLIVHMRAHTGDKPFHCNQCQKQYSIKGSLTIHMRTHTDEKPYHCDICKKQFSHRPNFTAHLRTHTGEKPYCCNNCKKQFSEKNSLTRHMRTHTRDGENPL